MGSLFRNEWRWSTNGGFSISCHGCEASAQNLHHLHEAAGRCLFLLLKVGEPQEAFHLKFSIRNLYWNTLELFFQRQPGFTACHLAQPYIFRLREAIWAATRDPAMATAADLHNQIALAKKTLEENLVGMRHNAAMELLFVNSFWDWLTRNAYGSNTLNFTSNSSQMDIHPSSCPNMEKNGIWPTRISQ